jgi:hypothetical protein
VVHQVTEEEFLDQPFCGERGGGCAPRLRQFVPYQAADEGKRPKPYDKNLPRITTTSDGHVPWRAQEGSENCEVCGRKEPWSSADKLLTCRCCFRGFHRICVGLKSTPKESWFCNGCMHSLSLELQFWQRMSAGAMSADTGYFVRHGRQEGSSMFPPLGTKGMFPCPPATGASAAGATLTTAAPNAVSGGGGAVSGGGGGPSCSDGAELQTQKDAEETPPPPDEAAGWSWWHPLKLPKHPDCPLAYARDAAVLRAVAPCVDFGSLFSAFGWSHPDNALYRMTYLHQGEAKLWCAHTLFCPASPSAPPRRPPHRPSHRLPHRSPLMASSPPPPPPTRYVFSSIFPPQPSASH